MIAKLPLLGAALALGCATEIGDGPGIGAGMMMNNGAGAADSLPGAASSSGAAVNAGGAGSNGPGTVPSTTGGALGATSAGAGQNVACDAIRPGRAPLRRLTTHEFNNTVRELLGDTTNPGSEFPSEILGKGFGNDADLQSVSDLLAEKYYSVAESVAARATQNSAALGRLHACALRLSESTEEACARSIVGALLPRAFRREVTASETEEFVELYRASRALASSVTFGEGVATVISAILQSPEFLYRPEFGSAVPGNSAVRQLTGSEIATRLSYLFWQTIPDAELNQAAESGALGTREGVRAQAERLLADPRARATVGFFFDNLLPISDLANLTRDEQLFPMFSSSLGAAMRREVQRTLEYEIFENTTPAAGSPYAPGSWPAALTAPYTFVNQALFDFYGAGSFAPGTNVTGTELQKVTLNPAERLGLLTLAGMMAGTATTNLTNPVLRGGFVVKHLMCRDIPLPSFAVAPPEPYTGKTARERFGKHSAEPGCSGCHQFLDPVGLALENYDAIGRYRTTERTTIDGVTYDTPIDPSGRVPGVDGEASGPVDLVRLLASSQEVQDCFAVNWMQFAYARVLDGEDECNRRSVLETFKGSAYNVKQLLIALTETDAFRYLPAEQTSITPATEQP